MVKLLQLLTLVLISAILLGSIAHGQSTWYTLGEEPDESGVQGWGGTQLDITSIQASSDQDNIYFKINVAGSISRPANGTLYWEILIDSDRSSRVSCEFAYDYIIYIALYSTGYTSVEVWDANGNFVDYGTLLGGGEGTNYWEISVGLSLIGNPTAVYVRAVTADNNNNVYDEVPTDDTGGGRLGEWWIYYIVAPTEPALVTRNDAVGDATGYYDIVSVSSGQDSKALYLKMSVNGQIPYYETDGAIYHFFLDTDSNPGTGYQIGGIGADYMVEFITGWVPKLYKYSGTTGSDWSWSILKCEDYYVTNPGGGNLINILVPVSDFPTSLSSGPSISASTHDISGNTKDVLDSPLPIPEPTMLVSIAAAVAAAAAVFTLRRG